MPTQNERAAEEARPSTREELACALEMSRRTLERLCRKYPDAPEMHEDGAYSVEEWQDWVASIPSADDDDEMRRLKAAFQKTHNEREEIRKQSDQIDLDKKRGELILKAECTQYCKEIIGVALAVIDENERQSIALNGDPAAITARAREIATASRISLTRKLERLGNEP